MDAALGDRPSRNILLTLMIIIALLASAGWTRAEESSAADQDKQAAISGLVGSYIQGAFAGRERLLKPESKATIAFVCPDYFCSAVAEQVRSKLPLIQGQYVSPAEAERSIKNPNDKVLIYVVFFRTSEEVKLDLSFPEAESGVILAVKDPHCSILRYSVKDVVKKVIIVTDRRAGDRANIVCVLTSILQGVGTALKDRYKEWIDYSASLDEKHFAALERGMTRAIRLHLWEGTKPGQTQDEVIDLLNGFDFDELLRK